MISSRGAFTDPELIKAVRNGEIAAFAGLYSRHAGAANRLARILTTGIDDPDRLVSASFSSVRQAMLAGGGPTVIFRTFLLETMRVLCEPAPPAAAGSVAAQALRRLPARWQLLLWHLYVEEEKPATIGPLLGLLPSEVIELGRRARERFTSAYVAQMRARVHTEASDRVAQHLADDLTEADALADVLAPVILGDLAVEYRELVKADRPLVFDAAPAQPHRMFSEVTLQRCVAAIAVAVSLVVLALAAVRLGTPARSAADSRAPRAVAHTTGREPVGGNTADLAVAISGSMIRGRSSQLRVRVDNLGPADSGILTLVLTLPAGTTALGAVSGGWQCSGRTTTLVCSHPALGSRGTANAVAGVSVGVGAPPGGHAAAIVSASARDPRPGNNATQTSSGVAASGSTG